MALILVVDDDPTVRQSVQRTLESQGHWVLLAADGKEAIGVWRESGADLVLLDLHMPLQDGVESLAQFRGLAPDLPVIMMSGGGQTGNLALLEDALLLGAQAALAKPFGAQELLDTVARTLKEVGPS